MTRMLLLGMALLLTGCVGTNISELVDAMGKDPATVCWTVTSVYGTVKGYRTAILNGTVTCNQDGLAVKAGTAGSSDGTVVVPVTVPPMTLAPAAPAAPR